VNVDAFVAVLSSDNCSIASKLEQKMNKLFGDKWLDVYELLRREK